MPIDRLTRLYDSCHCHNSLRFIKYAILAIIQTKLDLDCFTTGYITLHQIHLRRHAKWGLRRGLSEVFPPYPGVTSISTDLLGKTGKETDGKRCTQWHCYLQHCIRLVKVVTRGACLTSCGENYGMDCHGNRPDVTIWACVPFLSFLFSDWRT